MSARVEGAVASPDKMKGHTSSNPEEDRMSEDTTKQETRALIVKLRRRGEGYAQIADRLNRDGVPTMRGGDRWHGPTVRAIVLADDIELAAVAASRRVTDEGAVYACGVCGQEDTAANMILSSHTGARFCAEFNACRARAKAAS